MANADQSRRELVAAMLDPGFYPGSPRSVELRETHISWVFLAGKRAYKVKKPLTLPFLDYGTVARRHEMCREEVRLNRRFAPRIYLRVVGLTHADGRWRLLDGDERADEYAVEMLPVEESRSMAALAAAGTLKPAQVVMVAERLARLHGQAPAAPPERCEIGVLVSVLEENLTTLRRQGGSILGAQRIDSAGAFTRAFLRARLGALEARAHGGLVRDCHGDLRAEHVILPERGAVYIYDCIEFDPALRQIDVAADFAFLVMDLTAVAGPEPALLLIDSYRQASGDPGDDATLYFFAAYRAWVRAKVGVLRALELPSGSREREVEERDARAMMSLGQRFAWCARRPLILVLCGVAATGKTTLARELAQASGWTHLSSDVTRKRLAGLAPNERGAPDLYSEDFTLRTYRELGSAARAALDAGGGVVVDATFHRRRERAAFTESLGDTRGILLFIECRASEPVLISRIRARSAEPKRTSDADEEIVRLQLAQAEPLDEIAPDAREELWTEGRPTDLLGAVELMVDARVWRPAA